LLFGGKKAKDPVCGMKVDMNKAEFRAAYQGRTYYFCAPSCKMEFETEPKKFLGETRESTMQGHGGCC